MVIPLAALPGALCGAQFAALLFFLNPQLPFAPRPYLRAFLALAPPLTLLSALVHLPYAIGSARRAARLLPWSFAAVLLGNAVLFAAQASFYAYFLPAGINRRLLKAGSMLAVAGLVMFYTALVHALQRRPYGPRSQVGVLALALLSLYVAVERRGAFVPPKIEQPLPAELAWRPTHRLLVVGVDGASLDVLLPLAAKGELPFFSDLLSVGAAAHLSPPSPGRRVPLWTTVASGKYPYQHGIVDAQVRSAETIAPGAEIRLLPIGVGRRPWRGVQGSTRPVSRSDRRCRALWEILPLLGVRTAAIGWPATTPAPVELAAAVAERFFRGIFTPANVHPAELAQRVQRFHPPDGDIEAVLGQRFAPAASSAVRDGIAQDLWRESLARFLLAEDQSLEAMFLLLPGLGGVSIAHLEGFVQQEIEGRQSSLYEADSRALSAYYRRLDATLSALWELLPEPRMLVVVSAFGASPSGALYARRPTNWTDDRSWWEGDGLLLLRGGPVRPGAILREAALVDVVPTVLYALGLPSGRDLDGAVLTSLLSSEHQSRTPITVVPSYEAIVPHQAGG